jgi:predicted acetyltransferase
VVVMSAERTRTKPERVEVVSAAPEQQAVIANLLELYAYELSEAADLHVGSDGRYGYQSLPLYWKDKSRAPFLVKVDGHLGGFVLVSQGSRITHDPEVWDMAEFFVLRRYRRLGVGTKIAQEIWRRFPGRWEVRVLETNQPAVTFWQAAITSFTGRLTLPVRVEQGKQHRWMFAFDSSNWAGPEMGVPSQGAHG